MVVEIQEKFGLTNFMKQTKFASSWVFVAKIESSEILEKYTFYKGFD